MGALWELVLGRCLQAMRDKIPSGCPQGTLKTDTLGLGWASGDHHLASSGLLLLNRRWGPNTRQPGRAWGQITHLQRDPEPGSPTPGGSDPLSALVDSQALLPHAPPSTPHTCWGEDIPPTCLSKASWLASPHPMSNSFH